MARRRFSIAARFWLVLAVLVAAMACMGAAALIGLDKLRVGAEDLHAQVRSTTGKGEGRFHLGDLRTSVQLYAETGDPARRRVLRDRIDDDIAPAGTFAQQTLNARQRAALETVIGLWRADAFEGPTAERSSRRAEALLGPIVEATDAEAERTLATSLATLDTADRDYRRTRDVVLAVLLASLVLGLGMVLWLIRTVVPRTRDYPRFAARVAVGDVGARLAPTGATRCR